MPRRRRTPEELEGITLDGIPPEAREPKERKPRIPSMAKILAPLVALANTAVALVPPLRMDVLSEPECALLVRGLDEAQIANPALRRALTVASKAGGYAALGVAAVIILAPRLEAHKVIPQGTFPHDLYAETYDPPRMDDQSAAVEPAEPVYGPMPATNGVGYQETGGPVPYGYQRPAGGALAHTE